MRGKSKCLTILHSHCSGKPAIFSMWVKTREKLKTLKHHIYILILHVRAALAEFQSWITRQVLVHCQPWTHETDKGVMGTLTFISLLCCQGSLMPHRHQLHPSHFWKWDGRISECKISLLLLHLSMPNVLSRNVMLKWTFTRTWGQNVRGKFLQFGTWLNPAHDKIWSRPLTPTNFMRNWVTHAGKSGSAF